MKIDLQKIRELSNLELLARQLVEGFITGLHKSPYHGFSVEFAEHRLYNTGESTKDIDWKVYARTDKLFSKRYEEETNLRCTILIDNSSSMYYPKENFGKITFSVMAAAAIAFMLQKQRDAISITTFSDQIEIQTPVKSTHSHLHKMLILLEQLLQSSLKERKKTSIPEVLHQIANKIHKRSLVIIFSDMFDNHEQVQEIINGLHHLKYNNHEVLLFHVTDKKTEFDFEFEERPYNFIDLETREELKLHPSQIKEAYVEKVTTYFQDLAIKCGQFKIDFITADISDDFDKVLSAYLIKRKKMK
ncbi:MAG: DUF58 domain-containing protein [Cyclobacteriaceae bacterium]|nr:DUF58 domain-containing protein [Cyclobacteriaceae bacterium]MCK5467372.1 DUF58 domain-containing protein [Cyclobacteriaceae bacterium]